MPLLNQRTDLCGKPWVGTLKSCTIIRTSLQRTRLTTLLKTLIQTRSRTHNISKRHQITAVRSTIRWWQQVPRQTIMRVQESHPHNPLAPLTQQARSRRSTHTLGNPSQYSSNRLPMITRTASWWQKRCIRLTSKRTLHSHSMRLTTEIRKLYIT